MNLVIVESPTKAKTISKFLGNDYRVESSFGHIRDLPKSKLGVDIERDFKPQYVIPTKARKRVNQLKKIAAAAKTVILATDEDREGEAIAWHLVQALDLENSKSETCPPVGKVLNSKLPPKVERIVFHEITESAIEEALKNPRSINLDLVDAQQARRILDRLVGYNLSPFLWKKIVKGLSAGRVQSVALRLIVDREKEIREFKPEEYWSIVASLLKIKNQNEKIKNIEANLIKINGKPLEKFDIKTKEEADKIAADLKNCQFKITKIEKKETKKNPPTPFTTSTLQQNAAAKLGFSAKKTMFLAQRLYENGLISYMRTDSLNLSRESVLACKEWLNKEMGADYAVSAPRFFKTKSRLVQEAHEAIRPTNVFNTPEKLKLEKSEFKLYQLIWRRFVASQMPEARFDLTSVDVSAEPRGTKRGTMRNYGLRANGNVLKFDGFLKIWPQKFEEKELPEIKEGEELKLLEIKPDQHFTEPPPRYSEASLVKTLEEYGIGRPSTYAPIISVIQERNYVTKDKGRFYPTEIGELVNKVLVEHFPEIVDINFTAKMEEEFDEIAEGKIKWQKVIGEFYYPFESHLKSKYEEVSKKELIKEEKTGELCNLCGKPMVIKFGCFGKFLACSGFPECKNTKTIKTAIIDDKGEEMKCPKCKEGLIIKRRTRKGRFFYGCSRYPDCDFASWKKPSETNNSNN